MAGRGRYQTQWAAQFFAAAELARRGYLVALTLGNAQHADLLVETADGRKFDVDVKGQSARNWWLVRERVDHPDLYMLVYVPAAGQPPEYYLLSGNQMAAEMEAVRQQALANGYGWTGAGAGIRWKTGLQYRDCWEILDGIGK